MASAYEFISKQVIGSDTAYVDFLSLTSAYEHLQLRIIGKSTYTGGVSDDFKISLNYSAGTPGTWDQQGMNCLYQTVQIVEIFSAYDAVWISRASASSSGVAAGQRGVWIINITDYANTSKRASIQWMGGNVEAAQNNQSKQISWGGAAWSETTALSSIRIRSGSASIKAGTTLALYGMKSS